MCPDERDLEFAPAPLPTWSPAGESRAVGKTDVPGSLSPVTFVIVNRVVASADITGRHSTCLNDEYIGSLHHLLLMPPVNGKRRAAVVTDSDEEAESSTRRVTRSPVKRQRVRRRHDDSETDEEDAEVEHRTSGRRSSRANGHQTRVPDSEEEDVDEDDGPLEEYGRPELDRGDDG